MKKPSIEKTWENYLSKVKLEHDGDVLSEYLRVLGNFRSFLGKKQPTAERTIEYLQRFTKRSRNTRARYSTIINGALEAFGEKKVPPIKTPKQEPRYVPEQAFTTFFAMLGSKKRYKNTITRDVLMFRLMDAAGLRCIEAATLRVRDLFLEGRYEDEPYLVAHGKGNKDRTIPLAHETAQDLKSFIKGKSPEDLVFGLKSRSISNKFYVWKKKAGVQLSAHDLRRHFATELNALGVDIRTAQQLMGHSNVGTTQGYIGLPPEAARAAIQLRQEYISKKDKITRQDVIPQRPDKQEMYVESLISRE